MMRPNPVVQLMEQLAEMGLLVVLAPSPNDGVELLCSSVVEGPTLIFSVASWHNQGATPNNP